MTSWNSLPMELHFMVFGYLAACGPGYLSACAAVCKEWQAMIERRIFRQLKLRSTCLEDLGTMVTDRTRPLVQHIWLHIDLLRYTCLICDRPESNTSFLRNNCMIRAAVLKLFLILSTWGSTSGLTLELSANSPSDSKHCFKNYCFGDGSQRVRHWGVDHGWVHGIRLSAPGSRSIGRLFEPIDLASRRRLPKVDAVTRLVIRRHLRRRLTGSGLRVLLDKLPRLECLLFEPWREWVPSLQRVYDKEYKQMFEAGLPSTLKRLSIFEDFDEDHMTPIQTSVFPPQSFSLRRLGFSGLGEVIAERSLQLTHLSVSFLIDAVHFLRPDQQNWRWEHLEFLSLTSVFMSPAEHSLSPWALLYMAAHVAKRMPKLQEMILWHGGKGHACAFRYSRQEASIRLKSTWKIELHPSIEDLWQQVLSRHTGCQLHVDIRRISSAGILCHGDAIHELGLPSGVIDAGSLSQMRQEARMV